MRNRALTIIGAYAAASLAGCYSVEQYSGDGSITKGSGRTRYEILLPPLDMTSASERTFTVSGAPRERFMITLHVTGDPATLFDKTTAVHATLVDELGKVFDERKGYLGRAWVQASSSNPGQWLNLIAESVGKTEPRKLNPHSEYTLKVTVEPGTETKCIVSPRLWAGGVVPWE